MGVITCARMCRHIVAETVKAFDRIDVLVNNASMQVRHHLAQTGLSSRQLISPSVMTMLGDTDRDF